MSNPYAQGTPGVPPQGQPPGGGFGQNPGYGQPVGGQPAQRQLYDAHAQQSYGQQAAFGQSKPNNTVISYIVQGFLGLCTLFALYTAVSYYRRYSLVSDVLNGNFAADLISRGESIEDATRIGIIGTFGLIVLTAIIYMVWFFMSATSARTGMPAGLVFAAWVPVVSLVLPGLLSVDLWGKTKRTAPALPIAWWVTWVLYNLLFGVGLSVREADAENVGSDQLFIAAFVFLAIASVLGIVFVNRVTAAQQRNA